MSKAEATAVESNFLCASLILPVVSRIMQGQETIDFPSLPMEMYTKRGLGVVYSLHCVVKRDDDFGQSIFEQIGMKRSEFYWKKSPGS
jgi:hypothetical protein